MAEHSPLGGSGAERWTNCEGSVNLIKALRIEHDEDGYEPGVDPAYRREGTAMHAIGALALLTDADAYEFIGTEIEDVKITRELSNAVQVYVDYVRRLPHEEKFIEHRISSEVHKDFRGTVDCGGADKVHGLAIVDLKGGQGIMVEVEDNLQMIYYAFGFLEELAKQGREFDDETPAKLAIVQPRGYHRDGDIREWTTTVGHIKRRVHSVIVPAMERAASSHDLKLGDWCRFCPAKLHCPALQGAFAGASRADATQASRLSDDQLGAEWAACKGVRMYIKAIEEETFARNNRGIKVPGTKLVWQRTSRIFNAGAFQKASETFGDDAFNPPTPKSPAELEKLGPEAKEFVKENAHMPQGGLTVAAEDNQKPGIEIKSTKQRFAHLLVDKAPEV